MRMRMKSQLEQMFGNIAACTKNTGYPQLASNSETFYTQQFNKTIVMTACSYVPRLVQSWKMCWKNSRLSASKKGSLEPSNTNTTQCGTSLRPLSQKNFRDIHHSSDRKEDEVSLAPSRYIPRRENSWTDLSWVSYSWSEVENWSSTPTFYYWVTIFIPAIIFSLVAMSGLKLSALHPSYAISFQPLHLIYFPQQ